MTIEEQKIIAKFCAHCKYYWITSGCEHINHPSRKPHSECPDYKRIQMPSLEDRVEIWN